MTNGSEVSWVSLRWKWLVPAGCLGLLIVAVAWGVIIGGMVLAGMKTSDVYTDGVAAAVSHPEAIAVLGEPIEPGWWLMGSINVNGPSGNADIALPVSGPEGSGKLYVIGNKRAGQWTLELLELAIEGRGDRIDLLTK